MNACFCMQVSNSIMPNRLSMFPVYMSTWNISVLDKCNNIDSFRAFLTAFVIFLIMILNCSHSEAKIVRQISLDEEIINKRSDRKFDLPPVDGMSLFRSLRESSCTVDCSSTEIAHVCGSDGVTYASRCEVHRKVQCSNKRVNGRRLKVRSKGACPRDAMPLSKCFLERQKARRSSRMNNTTDVLLPSCNTDGSYNSVQCHRGTRYCWCVTKDGRHIPGTSISKLDPPICKERNMNRKIRNSKKKSGQKTCSSNERKSFNVELVKVFKDEYGRMLTIHSQKDSYEQLSLKDNIKNDRKILIWKFSQLDVNTDGLLTFKEIHSFRRMLRKLIKPRRCAKRFHNYCDSDQNRRIEKKEWTLCLGIDIKYGLTTAKPPKAEFIDNIDLKLKRPLLLPQDIQPAAESFFNTLPNQADVRNRSELIKRSCDEERRLALLHSLDEPLANVYIPRCLEDGRWRQSQCHNATRYCWCVEEDSGIPIPGMATYNVEPNCTVKKVDRKMKGSAFTDCSFDLKRRFIISLMADFSIQWNATTDTTEKLKKDQFSDREKVAYWILRTLDKNDNNLLEQAEWEDLRKTLIKNRNYPRTCRRRFLRYCDANSDKNISINEWKECLGLNHNVFTSLPRDPKINGKKNPFLDQLT